MTQEKTKPNTSKKSVLDILNEKIVLAVEAGHKPWQAMAFHAVFKPANFVRFCEAGDHYTGVMNQWLMRAIELQNQDLYEETAEHFGGDRMMAAALMSKLVSFTDLTRTFGVEAESLKGIPKLGMVYRRGAVAGWYDKAGQIFSARNADGTTRNQPTKEEIARLELKRRSGSRPSYKAMYVAAQVLEHLPIDLINVLREQTLEVQPPQRLTLDWTRHIDVLAKACDVQIKLANAAHSGVYSAVYNSIIIPPPNDFEHPRHWFEKAMVHILESVVQRVATDENVEFEDADREPIDMNNGLRLLLGEMAKDHLLLKYNIEPSGYSALDSAAIDTFKSVLGSNGFNLFIMQKICDKVLERVEPLMDEIFLSQEEVLAVEDPSKCETYMEEIAPPVAPESADSAPTDAKEPDCIEEEASVEVPEPEIQGVPETVHASEDRGMRFDDFF